jgi:predicted O-methyltransferase YrrM
MTEFLVIGFPKSGTSTLHRVFREAKMKSAHWVVREGFCGQVMYRDHRAGRNPLHQLRRFRCVAQADVCLPDETRDGEVVNFWPQLDFELIEAIQHFDPEVKFILNRRRIDDLIASIDNWASLRNRLIRSEIPGLPEGKGATDAELREWISGHYEACQEHFRGADNFLDLQIESPDAHRELERFVGLELPWWGVANRAADKAKRATGAGSAKAGEKGSPAPDPRTASSFDRPRPPAGGWKISGQWSADDAFALEALRPLGEAFLPWTGFALSPSAILKVLTLAEFHRPRVIVELGAGLSTVVFARYMRYVDRPGTRLVSADDNEQWLGMIDEYLARERLGDHAELVRSPRRPWARNRAVDGEDDEVWKYEPPDRWYSAEPILKALDGDQIDLLLIDGPKGKGTISRYPALPELYEHLAQDAVVILDDAQREPEQECVARWERCTNLTFEALKGTTLSIGRRPRS